MTRPFRHLALPAIAPLLFFCIEAIPVETIGCRNRGLLAVAVMALQGRMKGDPLAYRWILSALILAIPAVGLLMLG